MRRAAGTKCSMAPSAAWRHAGLAFACIRWPPPDPPGERCWAQAAGACSVGYSPRARPSWRPAAHLPDPVSSECVRKAEACLLSAE